MQFQPIENYGIIGDLRTIALAGMDRIHRFSMLAQD